MMNSQYLHASGCISMQLRPSPACLLHISDMPPTGARLRAVGTWHAPSLFASSDRPARGNALQQRKTASHENTAQPMAVRCRKLRVPSAHCQLCGQPVQHPLQCANCALLRRVQTRSWLALGGRTRSQRQVPPHGQCAGSVCRVSALGRAQGLIARSQRTVAVRPASCELGANPHRPATAGLQRTGELDRRPLASLQGAKLFASSSANLSWSVVRHNPLEATLARQPAAAPPG
jgi:hypothetical protein